MNAAELSRREEDACLTTVPAGSLAASFLPAKLMAFKLEGYAPYLVSRSGFTEFAFQGGTYKEVKKALSGVRSLPLSFIGAHGTCDILPDAEQTDKLGFHSKMAARIGGRYYLRTEVLKGVGQCSWLILYIRMKKRQGKVMIRLTDNPVEATRMNNRLVVTNRAPEDFPYLVPCGTRYIAVSTGKSWKTAYGYAGVKSRNKDDKAFESIVKNNRRVRAM